MLLKQVATQSLHFPCWLLLLFALCSKYEALLLKRKKYFCCEDGHQNRSEVCFCIVSPALHDAVSKLIIASVAHGFYGLRVQSCVGDWRRLSEPLLPHQHSSIASSSDLWEADSTACKAVK